MMFNLFGFCLAFWVTITLAENAKPTLAEVVWVSHADSHGQQKQVQLLYSKYDDDGWSDSTVIYESANGMATPVIATLRNGEKIVVWSEQFRRRTSLMYMMLENFKWGHETQLSDYGFENLGASLVVDSNNQVWVFWAAHQGDNDDIFYSRYLGSSWEPAQRLHSKNDVADYSPSANLNEQGDIEVHWRSYSATVGDYLDAVRIIDIKPSVDKLNDLELNDLELNNLESSDVDQEKNNDIGLFDIGSTNFLPLGAAHTIHFPHNTHAQSEALNRK